VTDMFIAPGTPNANLSYSGAFGNDFQITGDTYINSFTFFYDPAHSAGYPTRLSIWNRTSSTRLWTTTSLPTAPGTAGWITVPVSPQLNLTDTSKTYQCCLSAQWFWGWTSGAPSIASGFTGVAPKFQNSEPATSAGGWVYNAMYVGTSNTTGGDGGTGGSTGEGTPTFTGDLSAWLSTDPAVQLHATDGYPAVTDADVLATKLVVDQIKAVTDLLGTAPTDRADWVAKLWRVFGAMSDADLDAIGDAWLHSKDRLTGTSGGGGSAFYGPSGTQVASGVETLLGRSFTLDDLGAAVALLREQLTLSPDLADTSRWTLVDTFTGNGDALINAQADAFFFTLTTIPGPSEPMGIAGQIWEPRWGWVAPRVHGHFTQRQFQDVLPAVITSGNHFMDGLLIYAHPGYEWQCEPYVLDRS
jgi:hypothetical protein